MTITSDVTAPLVVVVGATGNQGGSVIRNLRESDKPYRIRGVTRDVTKASAIALRDQGVEITTANIEVGSEASVRDAFKGADIVFGVTNFWEHLDVVREAAQGKLLVDAAAAAGAKLFIFSGAPNVMRDSKGKYPNVKYLDSKADVVDYAREKYAGKLVVVDVQATAYMSNIFNPMMGLRKLDDGSYLWVAPTISPTEVVFSFIDIEHDMGQFVRQAIESEELSTKGGTLLAYSQLSTYEEARKTLEKVWGIKITLASIPSDPAASLAGLQSAGLPPHVAGYMVGGLAFMEEFGYHFGAEKSEEQKALRKQLARRTNTWEDFARAHEALVPK